MDSSGLSALSHCLHPTGRHAKCLGFLLECGADPNMRVSDREALSSLPVTSSSSLLSPLSLPPSFPISHFFSIPYLSSTHSLLSLLLLLTSLLSSTHSPPLLTSTSHSPPLLTSTSHSPPLLTSTPHFPPLLHSLPPSPYFYFSLPSSPYFYSSLPSSPPLTPSPPLTIPRMVPVFQSCVRCVQEGLTSS